MSTRFGAVALVLFSSSMYPLLAQAAGSDGPAPRCQGAYADDPSVLGAEVRDFDRHPEAVFSRCTRNTAVFECLSYGTDGAVRHQRINAVLHGTAFAYRRQGPDTLFLTNEHVAVWPSVTDAQHAVDGVPSGCKKVSESIALVDDEHDSYARDDVPLSRVAADPRLDIAILRAPGALPIMPWKVGHSGALTERNVVEVRGFPLGAFRATNVGKVISPHDHDDYAEWDHDDFVIDALLSAGNSGSPVLAISCATGEYELVGVYHAGYTAGSALNVVVGIDQVRDMMTTLKVAAHGPVDRVASVDSAARATLASALGPLNEMFFPFGSQVAMVRGAPRGALYFALFSKDFPATPQPLLVLEDLPAVLPTEFGELGRTWLGSARGLKLCQRGVLDGDTLTQLTRTLEALRADATGHATYRADGARVPESRQADDQHNRMRRLLGRIAASRVEQVQVIAELSERLGPQAAEPTTSLAALLTTDSATVPAGDRPAGGPAMRTLALSDAASASAKPGRSGQPAGRPAGVASPRP